MKKRMVGIIVFLVVFAVSAAPLSAKEKKKKRGGTLKRLSVIANNIALQEKTRKIEAGIYRRAEDFIDSSDIKQGIPKDFILVRCGEPTARAWEGAKWVYKPPASTYFKGEKIYFIFDEENKLLEWERVFQK